MPGVSGVTVVTTLVCFIFYHTRGCGCIARPAFPAPSGAEVKCTTRAIHVAGMRLFEIEIRIVTPASSLRKQGGGFTFEVQHLLSKDLCRGVPVKAFARG